MLGEQSRDATRWGRHRWGCLASIHGNLVLGSNEQLKGARICGGGPGDPTQNPLRPAYLVQGLSDDGRVHGPTGKEVPTRIRRSLFKGGRMKRIRESEGGQMRVVIAGPQRNKNGTASLTSDDALGPCCIRINVIPPQMPATPLPALHTPTRLRPSALSAAG